MFTNKHVVIALIIAPVLSVLAWFAVGRLAGEDAAPAQPGQSYPLVAKSSCRWPSGQCELENGDFLLTLRIDRGLRLSLSSAHPLEGVMLGVFDPEAGQLAEGELLGFSAGPMVQADESGLLWETQLARRPSADDRFRLVAGAGGSTYYAETSTQFAQPADGAIPNPG